MPGALKQSGVVNSLSCSGPVSTLAQTIRSLLVPNAVSPSSVFFFFSLVSSLSFPVLSLSVWLRRCAWFLQTFFFLFFCTRRICLCARVFVQSRNPKCNLKIIMSFNVDKSCSLLSIHQLITQSSLSRRFSYLEFFFFGGGGPAAKLRMCAQLRHVAARSPPKLSWREAFQWADCCRARRHSGVCSKGILRPAGWWLGSLAAGGAAGQTCLFAAGSCTWRSPTAPRWPAPGRFLPGGSSPGSSHLQEQTNQGLDKITYEQSRCCWEVWGQ